MIITVWAGRGLTRFMRCGCAMHQRCGGGDMALGASFRRPGLALSGAHFIGKGATMKPHEARSHAFERALHMYQWTGALFAM